MIHSVNDLVLFNNRLLVIGNENARDTDINIPADGARKFVAHKNYLYYQLEEFGAITVLDSTLQPAGTIREGLNLYNSFQDDNYLLLPDRNTMTHWQLFSFDHLVNTGLQLDYHVKLANHYYTWSLNTVKCFTPLSASEKWIVPFSKKIDRPVFGNDEAIFVPLEDGQLVAIKTTDGSIKWMLEGKQTGGYFLSGKWIYKNEGTRLLEIDGDTGAISKAIEYKNIIDIPSIRMTGGFKVYADIVLLKQQRTGQVALINRNDFSLKKMVDTGSQLSSDENDIHWHDGQVYVLDRNQQLQVF